MGGRALGDGAQPNSSVKRLEAAGDGHQDLVWEDGRPHIDEVPGQSPRALGVSEYDIEGGPQLRRGKLGRLRLTISEGHAGPQTPETGPRGGGGGLAHTIRPLSFGVGSPTCGSSTSLSNSNCWGVTQQLQRQSVSLLEMPVYARMPGLLRLASGRVLPTSRVGTGDGRAGSEPQQSPGQSVSRPPALPDGSETLNQSRQLRERRWSSPCSGFSAELYSSYYACISLQTPSLPHCNIMCIYV